MANIGLRIQVDGIDALMKRVERLEAMTVLKDAVTAMAEKVSARLQKYPSPPANSQYERTGALGRAWAHGLTEATGLGSNQYADMVSIDLRNDVGYAPYVQSAEEQAEIHRGRWETAEQILVEETGPFLSDVTEAIKEAF